MPTPKLSLKMSRWVFASLCLLLGAYLFLLLRESMQQQYEGDISQLGGFFLWLLGYGLQFLLLTAVGWLTFKGPYQWRSRPFFGKWGYYSWLLILFWLFFEFLQFRSFHESEWVEENLFIALFGWVFVMGFVAVADAVRQRRLQATFEQEKATAELHALRSQLNPHFLFNALNTLYAQAISGEGDRLAELIEELSGMLRFSLAQSRREWVLVTEEMAFLSRYINLQKARLTDGMLARLHIELDTSPPELYIPPLLLLPIVENFFKYGVFHASKEPLILRIHFKGEQLSLYAQNPVSLQASGAGTGQGIRQVSRRLDLLFGDAYTFKIGEGPAQYTTELSLTLARKSEISPSSHPIPPFS